MLAGGIDAHYTAAEPVPLESGDILVLCGA